jgi:hypothetical protein
MDDHNLSRPTKNNEKPPLPQHTRLALGEKVTGTSNPYGAAKGNTTKKVGNAPCTY